MALIVNGRGIAGIRSGVAAGPSTPSIIYDGLKLYIDAGNTSSYPGTGTVWTDLSGNGNNGTLNNMGTTGYTTSNGGSLVFDGSDDYVSISNINFGKVYSINIWINVSDLNSRVWIGGIDTTEYHMNFLNGEMYNRVNNNLFTFATSVSTNVWYNIVLIRNNTTMSCYKNGSLISSITVVGATTDFILYRIGSSPSGFYGNGKISNVEIYNRTLSAEEVTQNYNALKGRFGL
jgi:hypothetical protein